MKILVAFATLLLCSCGLFTTNSQTPTLASKDAWLTSSNILSLAATSQLGAGDTAVAFTSIIYSTPSNTNYCTVFTGLGVRCTTGIDSFTVFIGSELTYLANRHEQIILNTISQDTLFVRMIDSTSLDSNTTSIVDIRSIDSNQFLMNRAKGTLNILDSIGEINIRTAQSDSFGYPNRGRSSFWKTPDASICMVEWDLNKYKITDQRVICVTTTGLVDSLVYGAGLPDSLKKNLYLPFVAWKGALWNVLEWREGQSNSSKYYDVNLALTSMNFPGGNFVIYPTTLHSDQTNFAYKLLANDALGAYVILAENYPTGEGTGALLTIYRADSKNELQQIKRYHVDGISLGIKTAWAVDANHFAVVLNNSFWNDGADNIMLFDKNGNVVKGL